MLQAYRAVAADHVYQLLGDVPLGEKAEQMSERLYNSISISEDAGPPGPARLQIGVGSGRRSGTVTSGYISLQRDQGSAPIHNSYDLRQSYGWWRGKPT
jgi:hypothetical protein